MLSRWRAVRLVLQNDRRAAAYTGDSSSGSDLIVRSVRELVGDAADPLPPSPSSLASSALSAADLRALLARHNTGAALPGEISAVLRASYDAHRADPAARLRFFRVLGESFGLRGLDSGGSGGGGGGGGAVSAAYAAFDRIRAKRASVGSSSGGGGGGGSESAETSSEGGGHDAAALARAAARLRDALTPPYMRLLLPVAQEPGGIACLVAMRGDLLVLLGGGGGGGGQRDAAAAAAAEAAPPLLAPASCAPALRALSDDLRAALSSWFAPGLLRLRVLSWSSTPAALLDRAARADRVHPMRSLEELRQRLDRPDRRVFAFERDGDPLVVLHAALFPAAAAAAGGGDNDPDDAAADAAVPSRLDQILGPPPPPSSPLPPATATAAMGVPPSPPPPAVACFYSVSVASPGLAGVDLGNLLIKRAAASLAADFPSIRRLATLSPMPLMRATVERRLAQLAASIETEADGPAVAALSRLLASGDVAARLERAREALDLQRGGAAIARRGGSSAVGGAAADLLALFGGGAGRARKRDGDGGGDGDGSGGDERDPWLSRAREHGDAPLFDEVLLPRLAAIYLACERRRGLALDPVAAFHLRNGAVAWRVAALADRGRPEGLAASFGAMANYLYQPGGASERNNRRYLVEREVALGPMVEGLLLPWPPG